MKATTFTALLVHTLLSTTPFMAICDCSLLEKGARAHADASFDDAIAYYERELEAVSRNTHVDSTAARQAKMEVTKRIAQAHLSAGRHHDAMAILEAYPYSDHDPLLATTYLADGNPRAAIAILSRSQQEATLDQETLWQLGRAYYLAGEPEEAKAIFELFAPERDNHLYALSQIYLSRLAIDQRHYREALQHLQTAGKVLPPGDVLSYERHFLAGDALFLLQDYLAAADEYERSLPAKNSTKVDWAVPAQKRIASSYLAIADQEGMDKNQRSRFLQKAFDALQVLQQTALDDDTWLTLGRYYIVRGRRMHDLAALAQAEAILGQANLFSSREAQAQALLLRAEAAPTYRDRDSLYRQITDTPQHHGAIYAQGWYLRGINDLEEAKLQLVTDHNEQEIALVEGALRSLKRAFELSVSEDPHLAGHAAIATAKAYLLVDSDRANTDGIAFIERVVRRYPEVLEALSDPDELFYLQAQLTARRYPDKVESQVNDLIHRFPQGRFADSALYLLGTEQYRRGDILPARETWERLTTAFPQSSYAGNAYYWQARTLEAVGDRGAAYQALLRKVYTEYPHSTAAAEAYYSCYTPAEYLQGNAEALAHLEKLPTLFPSSPIATQAFLLIGLDYKRTRLSPEGKVLRKRNWNKAIQAFQDAEAHSNTLQQQGLVSIDIQDTLTAQCYRANLERALANLAVASESEGAKKHIYLEYAIDMFEKLIAQIEDPQRPLPPAVTEGEPYPLLLQEASYHLALAYALNGDDEAADRVLNTMLHHYETAGITRSYYLSRVRYQQARIAQRAKHFEEALSLLALSEEAAKGKVLSSEEKLDLWLQRSTCYRSLGLLDQAMLELSRMINDDAISGQRIQAMYLRAEIYEEQGRPELAHKQLEATAKKGGPWAQQAKEKLDRDYRYD